MQCQIFNGSKRIWSKRLTVWNVLTLALATALVILTMRGIADHADRRLALSPAGQLEMAYGASTAGGNATIEDDGCTK